MPSIYWANLQYAREQELFASIRPTLERLRDKYMELTRLTQELEQQFYLLLSHSLKLNGHPEIEPLIEELKQKLNLDAEITLFLYQSGTAEAACMPRFNLTGGTDVRKLMVLVSQHFMNCLDRRERLCVLGHELGHLVFQHVNIPAKAIMASPLSLEDSLDLKNSVQRWQICSEISCDLLGLYCCGADAQVFNSAMLKYSTGLHSSGVAGNGQVSSLADLALRQFEEISNSVYDPAQSTHPLIPLRLKIALEASRHPLFQWIGQHADDEAYHNLLHSFNQTVDAQVRRIYPDIVPSHPGAGRTPALKLVMAVALADGQVTDAELTFMNSLCGSAEENRWVQEVIGCLRRMPASTLAAALVSEAVTDARAEELQRMDIVAILRQCVAMAAADTHIDRHELETIFGFAREFGLAKEDIAALVGQMKK